MRIALARLVPVALLAAVLTGCATGSSAYKKGYTAAKVHDWDTAVAHFRTAVQDDPDKPEYRIALERAMMEAALLHASAGKDFEAQGQLDAALREFHRASEYDPSNRQLAAHVMDARPADCGADRGEPPAPEDRRDARAGAPDDAGADAQSRLARAARPALHGQRPRPAQVHRGRHRHQHHLHRRLPRSAAVLDPDLRRHARAGAAAGAVGERAVLQGAERAHHPRHPRHRAEPEPVRGDGRADLLPLARGSAGGRATAERGDARAGRADGARLLREQDPELDHGPRVGAAGGDHGAARRGQRPAAGRDHPRRADPGSQPGPREAVRARPERVFHHRRLLSRSQAQDRSETLERPARCSRRST